MQNVERHIYKDGRFEDLCFKSALLYNAVLYEVRQAFFEKRKVKEYELSTKFANENQSDYRNLPVAVSQYVFRQVFQCFSSWLTLLNDYKKNPSKYTDEPRMPKYKKGRKQNMIVFTKAGCRIKKDGYIHFAKEIIEPIKTNVKSEELKQVRIVPQATCYIVEVVYERKEQDLGLDKSRILSIDLGIGNICTAVSNIGDRPFIINGRCIKSFNQWFNKLKSKFMSYVGDRGISNRLKGLNNRRTLWIEDKLHKISRYIVNYCISNNIGSIVIGHNKGWKEGVNLGSKTNQQFTDIPFSRLIQKISYKANLVGIDVHIVEESYTSKVDHLSFEELCHHNKYVGKRVKRGMFQSASGVLVNADVNGAIGIGRKVFGDSYVREIVDRGIALTPVRISVL